MHTLHRFFAKITIVSIISVSLSGTSVLPAQSAGIINANSQLWEQGMAWWADTIAIEPGQEFKIYLSAGNFSETGAVAASAVMKHALPVISLPGSGTQAVAYVPGSTFYYYDGSGVWSPFSDDGTSPFDGLGLAVTADGTLNPFEGANYKYTVRVPDTLPAGTNSLNWNAPQLSFNISGAPFTVSSENNNSISIENLPQISSFALNATSFSAGQSIAITASGTAGLSPRVEIGSVATINLTESSAGQYTGAYVLPNSIVQSGITPRLYMVGSQGKGSYLNYGSSISIDTTPAPQPTPAPVSGGRGGARASYSPNISQVSSGIQNKGEKIILQLSSGANAELSLTKTLDKKVNFDISELTAQEREKAAMSQPFGNVIANNIYSVTLKDNVEFPTGVQLALQYQQSHLGSSCTSKDLILAHHQSDLERWVALASTANEKNMSITAPIKEEGYYAIACFAGGEDEAETIDSDNGFILGTSVGAYPNGTLLRSAGSSEVWHISADQRHWVPSVQIFEAQFNWNDIIDLPSSKQLNLYSRGIDVFFPTGTIIKEKNSNIVYRVSANKGLQPIISHATFVSRGYRFNDIVEVQAGDLANYPREPYIDGADKLYTGDLVKLSDKRSVYYIDGSVFRPIPSYDIFVERKFNLSSIRIISLEQSAKYGIGDSMPYPDGTLIKGSRSAVYVMSDRIKRPILSGDDFEALLYDWNNVIIVPDSILEDADTGTVIKILE